MFYRSSTTAVVNRGKQECHLENERCIRQNAQIAVAIVKFLSNQQKADLSIAKNVIERKNQEDSKP